MPPPPTSLVHGHCDPAFRGVRDAFEENFASRGEVGAACCIVVGDRTVVDLVGGWADADRTREWQPDTMVNFYSAGKALLALIALQQVGAGLLDLDAPIADVWPEFGFGGKATATLRHALTHRAGVPAIRQRLTNDDLWHWDRMAAAVAATPAWPIALLIWSSPFTTSPAANRPGTEVRWCASTSRQPSSLARAPAATASPERITEPSAG